MKHLTKSILIFFLAMTLATFNGYCQQRNDKVDLKLLETHITEWQTQLHVPDVGVGIIENGKILSVQVFGKTPGGQPAPKNILFDVASVTKVVFTTLVLNLVQEGKWNLDEPLYHYYTDPEVAADPFSKILTTRHVLSQQSGFVNWRWNHPTGKLTFDFKPGTKFNYSGEGMEYLRKAIESKFHKSLSELADSIIFKPFKMTDTREAWDGKKDYERFSRFYNANGEEYKGNDYHPFPWGDNAADGLITTVGDLSRFGIEVMNGARLSPELFKEMIKTQAVINLNLQQGLGWRIVNGLPNKEYAIQHGGNDRGLATIIVLLPKSKRGVIVFTNGDNGLIICNNIVREVLPEGTEIIYKSYKSADIKDAPKPIQLDERILHSYVGKYSQPDGKVLEITQKGKGLLLNMPGAPTLDLLPETKEIFFLLDFDPTITFTKDAQGNVDAALITDGGNIIKCVRNGDK